MPQQYHSEPFSIPDDGEENFYHLLGLSPEADAAAVKQAWRLLAARWHPDTLAHLDGAALAKDGNLSSPAEAAAPSEQFLRIQRAYAVLGNPDRRRVYDELLRSQHPRQPQAPGDPQAVGNSAAAQPHPWQRAVSLHLDRFGPWRAGFLSAARLARVRYLAIAVVVSGIVLLWETGSARKRVAPTATAEPITATSILATPETRPAVGLADTSQTVPPAPTTAAVQDPRERPSPLDTPGPRNTQAPRNAQALEASPSTSAAAATADMPQPARTPRTVARAAAAPATAAVVTTAATVLTSPAVTAPPSGTALAGDPREGLGAVHALPAPMGANLHANVIAPPPAPPRAIPDSGTWLAGCVARDSGTIYTGLVHIQDHAAHLLWQALGDRRVAGERRLQFGNEESPRAVFASLDTGHRPPAPLEASLQFSPGPAAMLHLESAPAPVPCSDWRLEPAIQAARGLGGRWLAPEPSPGARSGAAEALFLLESLELQLDPAAGGITGRLRGQYRLNPTHPAAGAAASTFHPLVEFQFAANPFPVSSGKASTLDIPWRSPTVGEGSIRIAPLSPGRIAIHWQRHGIPPGRIQLSGGSAILLRRH